MIDGPSDGKRQTRAGRGPHRARRPHGETTTRERSARRCRTTSWQAHRCSAAPRGTALRRSQALHRGTALRRATALHRRLARRRAGAMTGSGLVKAVRVAGVVQVAHEAQSVDELDALHAALAATPHVAHEVVEAAAQARARRRVVAIRCTARARARARARAACPAQCATGRARRQGGMHLRRRRVTSVRGRFRGGGETRPSARKHRGREQRDARGGAGQASGHGRTPTARAPSQTAGGGSARRARGNTRCPTAVAQRAELARGG